MTTTTAPQTQSPLSAVAAFFRRLTVDEYHRMLEVGVLVEGEPVELLDGVMVNKWGSINADPPSLLSISGFRKITVAEYHKMIDAGIIKEGERVELLEGYLVKKMSHNTPHGVTVQKLTKRLVQLAPSGWEPRVQLPITLPNSEPEPDGVLARGDEATFGSHHPLPTELGLVIEVSDSSLAFDRRDKGRIYAQAGIPVYWIINLQDRHIEVYTDPDPAADPPAYATRIDYGLADAVPLVLDGGTVATLPVAELIA